MVAVALILVGLMPGVDANNLRQIVWAEMVHGDDLTIGNYVEAAVFAKPLQSFDHQLQLAASPLLFLLIEGGDELIKCGPVVVSGAQLRYAPTLFVVKQTSVNSDPGDDGRGSLRGQR